MCRYGLNLPASKNKAPLANAAQTNPTDAALITFTTGSTGNPKAARRSHAFLNAQFKALCEKINPGPGDIAMPVLPIVLLCNLGVGASSVISDYPARKPRQFNPAQTVERINKLGINRITSSPYFVKRLAEYCIENSIPLPGLQQIFTGGAAVFPKEAKLYLEAFPNCRIEVVYGSTEAEPIASVKVDDLIRSGHKTKGLLVGNIYDKTQLKIIPVLNKPLTFTSNIWLDEVTLGPGEIGEIIVAGDHVLGEYLHSPEAWKQNKILAGDTLWHRTGDSGYIDQNGDLYLCGRCKQLIEKETGGYWAPFVIEGLLQQLPEIQIGTLIQAGRELIIVAEAKSHASMQNIQKELIRILPHALQNIRILKNIPRDPRHHSKIDYGKLREILNIG